jgi:hypothetical protein
MTDKFNEIKGNCGHRYTTVGAADHCGYHNDDCRESCCPYMAKPLSPTTVFSMGDEVPLSQCPMCGGEVPPDQVDWSMQRSEFPFLSGMIYGVIGAVSCLGAIASVIAWWPGVKQLIALYVMNHWT